MNEVRRVMRTNLITVTLDETVQAAAQRMTEHHVGALIVLDDGKVVGMFTERDVLDRVVSTDKAPKTTRVGEVCTRNPVTVPADTPVLTCYQLIKDKGFRHLPITSEDGAPLGILSARDFFQCLAVRSDPEVSIEEVCAQLGKLSTLMAEIERLP